MRLLKKSHEFCTFLNLKFDFYYYADIPRFSGGGPLFLLPVSSDEAIPLQNPTVVLVPNQFPSPPLSLSMEALKAAIGDGVITFLWMFCISTVGPTTAVIAKHLELKSLPLILGITVLLLTALLLIFSQISKLLGKASFNPANTAAFYAAGVSEDSLFSMALRFPAQVSRIFLFLVEYLVLLMIFLGAIRNLFFY